MRLARLEKELNEVPLATETPEHLETVRQIKRIVSRNMGRLDQAVQFEADAIRIDVFAVEMPPDFGSMTIDGIYMGHFHLTYETPQTRIGVMKWKHATKMPVHYHPHSEHMVVLQGEVTVTMFGHTKTYYRDEKVSIDPGVVNQVAAIEGTDVQISWLR